MEGIKLTGCPFIDRPWLKYYREEALKAQLSERSLYQPLYLSYTSV